MFSGICFHMSSFDYGSNKRLVSQCSSYASSNKKISVNLGLGHKNLNRTEPLFSTLVKPDNLITLIKTRVPYPLLQRFHKFNIHSVHCECFLLARIVISESLKIKSQLSICWNHCFSGHKNAKNHLKKETWLLYWSIQNSYKKLIQEEEQLQ
jgi:hypothetical protein